MLITLMTFHPHKGGLWGPQALHTLSPPNALFPRHTQGLTHRSRLHCSSQIPCTSLQITEQKLASAGKQGHSCKVPVAPPRGPGQVLGEPTLNSTPHVGVLNPDPSSRPSSLKSSLVLPASLPQTPQGEVPGPGGHCVPLPRRAAISPRGPPVRLAALKSATKRLQDIPALEIGFSGFGKGGMGVGTGVFSECLRYF